MGEAENTVFVFRPFWIQAAIQYHLDIYIQITLLQENAFAHRERPSHRDGLQRETFYKEKRRCSYTEMLLTQRCLYTRCFRSQILLHTDDFGKKKLLDAGTFTHRCLYTEMLVHTVVLTYSYVYAVLLHASSFAQRFYTQGLLHRHTLTYTDKSFTHKYFCTAMFF